jgi:N6-adenosine-specific RNA methylase IME4
MTKIVNFKNDPIPAENMLSKIQGRYATILADPPWQFMNRTGKVAPEHKRLLRYPTMELEEIMDLPVGKFVASCSHLYLWTPNALLTEGLAVMRAWGFIAI